MRTPQLALVTSTRQRWYLRSNWKTPRIPAVLCRPYARLIEALIALIRARFDRVERVGRRDRDGWTGRRRRLPRGDRDVSKDSLTGGPGRFREAIAQSMRTVGEVTRVHLRRGHRVASNRSCMQPGRRARTNCGRACPTDHERRLKQASAARLPGRSSHQTGRRPMSSSSLEQRSDLPR